MSRFQTQQQVSRRYIEAFVSDAADLLLIWHEAIKAIQQTEISQQPLLPMPGWVSLSECLATLSDNARRVDLTDLANFIATMAEPATLVRDGLIEPSALVINSIADALEVVDQWIRQIVVDTSFRPLDNLVRFASSSMENAIALAQKHVEKVPERETQPFDTQVTPIDTKVTERLELVAQKLEHVVEQQQNLAKPTSQATHQKVHSQHLSAGVDREALAKIRGHIIKHAYPHAWLIFKLGSRLYATKAANIKLVDQSNSTMLVLEQNSNKTALTVDSIEGFTNRSDESIDHEVRLAGPIPTKWVNGIGKWGDETLNFVDLQGYLASEAA